MKTLIKILITALLFMNISSAKDLLLVDTSGSMNSNIIKEPIKKIVKNYLSSLNEVIGFNDNIYKITHENKLIFKGGTSLSKALNYIYPMDIEYTILITDGKPSNEKAVLKASQKIKAKGIKLCSVFISNKDKKIPTILEEISDEIFISKDIEKVFTLCNSSVKNRLLGKVAVQKRVDENKFDF